MTDTIHQHHKFNRYGAKEDGTIWSCATTKGNRSVNWRQLKETVDSNGYCSLKVWDGPTRTTLRIHRFVFECINGPIENGLEINHKDKNKKNNSIGNLEVVTHSQNMKHAAAVVGENNPASRFCEQTIKAVRALHQIGWNGAQIAKAFGMSDAYVHKIIFRKVWDHII